MKTEIITPPQVPSKWDIIPIHASDVASFQRCRRYWDWSSPARLNLRRRVDISGINFPLWFGSGIHYALEMYYNPLLQRDPVEAFKTWYEYQWNGGVVTEDWLERTYDNFPQPITTAGEYHGQDLNLQHELDTQQLYEIRGLRELHPDPVHEEFEQHYDLGVGMMEFYKEYAAREDQFVVVAAESTFSVPLGFEAIDSREDSPNYGQKLEVHARGKRDAIAFFLNTERYGLLDHKTAASIDEEYFTKLEMDAQCMTYSWASQEEAKIHDLPYKRIDGVLYNVLAKKYPKPPSILKDGFSPSVNRQEESTTAELFMHYITSNGLEALYENTEKWKSYYEWLSRQGERNFIQRQPAIYNPYQLAQHGQHIRMIAEEMLNPSLSIYPTPSSNWTCTRCQFRAPCLAAYDGSDFVHMLADGYEENRGR